MPIRFRCTSCSRLLGIARRKAGSVIRCPDCGAEVAVPNVPRPRVAARGPDQPRAERRAAAPPGNGTTHSGEAMPLFERPDFESLLNPAVKKATAPPPEPPPPPAAAPARSPAELPLPEPVISVQPYDLEPVGMIMTRGTLTVMAVVVVVLIGLAFAAGYLVAAARLPAAG